MSYDVVNLVRFGVKCVLTKMTYSDAHLDIQPVNTTRIYTPVSTHIYGDCKIYTPIYIIYIYIGLYIFVCIGHQIS